MRKLFISESSNDRHYVEHLISVNSGSPFKFENDEFFDLDGVDSKIIEEDIPDEIIASFNQNPGESLKAFVLLDSDSLNEEAKQKIKDSIVLALKSKLGEVYSSIPSPIVETSGNVIFEMPDQELMVKVFFNGTLTGSNERTGALEDVIWGMVPEPKKTNPFFKCLDGYAECLDRNGAKISYVKERHRLLLREVMPNRKEKDKASEKCTLSFQLSKKGRWEWDTEENKELYEVLENFLN